MKREIVLLKISNLVVEAIDERVISHNDVLGMVAGLLNDAITNYNELELTRDEINGIGVLINQIKKVQQWDQF